MKRASFVRIWEFEVAPARRAEFEDVYGAAGDWAALFRAAEGWISTRLYCDPGRTGLYRTVDAWHDEAAWNAARAKFSDRYESLDEACSALSTAQRELQAGPEDTAARRLLEGWVELFPEGLGDGPLALDGELDLHRFPPQQVADLVRSYVEECYRAGILELRIVHGKGIGKQREIVHGVLGDMPEAVAEFGLAPPERGGWGATLVKLKVVDHGNDA